MAYPMYSNNMSLVAPQDVNVMQPQNGLYGTQNQGWGNLGMNAQAMNAADAMPNQTPQQDPVAAYMEQMRQQQAMKMIGQGVSNMGKGMQMQMPSGNTAQIMRDQSRPQFAGYLGGPQQQMAMALRNRG